MASKVSLHVEEYGSGDPTVVLLHGFGGSARNFRGQAAFLAPRHHVVLFDARGHARSDAPEDPAEYERSAFVADAHDVLLRAGTPRVVLGGVSMGAGIALDLALAYPDSLAGLILASFPLPGRLGNESWALRFADAIERDGLSAAGSEFVWQGSRFDANAAKWIRQGFMEHQPHALVATLRRVIAKQPSAADMARALSEFRVPTLIIAGEQDASALAGSHDLARLIPNASFIVVAGAGHVVNLQKPESFNRDVDDFLRRL